MGLVAPAHAWAAPALVLTGFAASLAEGLGITLVVVFLYTLMSPGGNPPAAAAPLDWLSRTGTELVGGGLVLAALIFVLIAGRAGLSLIYTLISSTVKNRLSESVRNRLHRQYLEMPFEEIQRHDQGQLLHVLATLSWSVADGYMSATRAAINLCAVLVFVAFLLALSPPITAVATVGSLALFTALRLLSRRARRFGERAQAVNRSLAEKMLVTLQAMRTLRAFGQEGRHQAAFEGASAEARRVNMELDRLHAFINPATEIGYLALLCGIVFVAQSNSIPFSTTLACVALLYRLQPHVRELEGNLLYLAQVGPSLRQVTGMLNRSGKARTPPGSVPFDRLREGVRFEEVTFQHAGATHPALERASFSIPAGRVTAIVGESGAGKTTVVNLLMRLYEPGSGRVLVDGTPLADLARADWLSRVAFAGQDVEPVEGTVEENIRMSRPEADQGALLAAAAVAGVSDFVASLPEGFGTWIGRQGWNLSGGQRQRIGIARAVLHSPDLLILDEATNALDGGLEDAIRGGMRRSFAGRTVVLITHRLETVLHADHVVCLHAGRVVEAGPPALLRARADGAFARMVARDRLGTP